MKKLLLLLTALALPFISLASIRSLITSVGASEVCPDGGGWTKLEDRMPSYVAPVGYVVDQICVKGGSENSSNGYLYYIDSPTDVFPCVFQLGLGTQSASVTNSLLEGCAEISHASFHIVEGACDCASPTPTPAPSPTPSPTPHETPSPTPEITPMPSPTPTPPAESTPAPSATPTPVPSVAPTSTPSPSSSPGPEGKTSKLSVAGLTCEDTDIKAEVELTDNNRGVGNVRVKFTYNGNVKEATTNQDGKASVVFGYSKDDSVFVEPEGEFSSQSAHVSAATNCAAVGGGEILGATTTKPQGQVFGYASTGVLEDTLMRAMGVGGLLMTTAGSVLYGKKRK